MTEDWLKQRKRERLLERWTLLDEKRARLWSQYIIESRSEEQMRIQAVISQTQKNLDEVEEEMAKLGASPPNIGSNTQIALGHNIVQTGPSGSRLSPERAEVSTTPTVDSVLALFKQLNPRDQLDAIMLRLEMPAAHRPSPTLSLSQQEIKVIEWAKRKDGFKRLDAVLRAMIAEQENG